MRILMTLIIIGLLVFEGLSAYNGKISGVTYFDYYVDADQYNEFEIHRSYFTYKTELSDGIHFKFQLDIGRLKKNEANQQLFAYTKNAKVDWKSPIGQLTFGLQGMNIFNIQEKTWGYRFIEKSAMDLNKWASSADLGIGYTKSFGSVHTNLLITNGPGYKKAESNKYKKISGQFILGEKNLIKNTGYNLGTIVVYEDTDIDPNTILGIFGGYANSRFRLGSEWERLRIDSGTEQMISIYGNSRVKAKVDLYARLDQIEEDQYVIAGINYLPEKGLMIAPNIRYSKAGSSDSEIEYRVNFQFKF